MPQNIKWKKEGKVVAETGDREQGRQDPSAAPLVMVRVHDRLHLTEGLQVEMHGHPQR